jgi:hypothetical protein
MASAHTQLGLPGGQLLVGETTYNNRSLVEDRTVSQVVVGTQVVGLLLVAVRKLPQDAVHLAGRVTRELVAASAWFETITRTRAEPRRRPLNGV